MIYLDTLKVNENPAFHSLSHTQGLQSEFEEKRGAGNIKLEGDKAAYPKATYPK